MRSPMGTQAPPARAHTGLVGMCVAFLRSYLRSSADNWSNVRIDKRKVLRQTFKGVREDLVTFDGLGVLEPETKRRLRPLVSHHETRLQVASAWLSAVGLALTTDVAVLGVVIALAPTVVHIYFGNTHIWTPGGVLCLIGALSTLLLFFLSIRLLPWQWLGRKLAAPVVLLWAWAYVVIGVILLHRIPDGPGRMVAGVLSDNLILQRYLSP